MQVNIATNERCKCIFVEILKDEGGCFTQPLQMYKDNKAV